MTYTFYITPEDYEIAAQNGISQETLEARVRDYGWKIERAITQEVKRTDRRYWAKIAEQNGISYKTFISRVHRPGWSMERAATEEIQGKAHKAERLASKRMYSKEMYALAETNGIPARTFRRRVKNGMSEYEAATTPLMTRREMGLKGRAARDAIYGRDFIFGSRYKA